MKWALTKVITGAITNLGAGLFFTYGALIILFVPLPFENFFFAFIFGILPMLGSWALAFKGYKIDVQNHKTQQSIENIT